MPQRGIPSSFWMFVTIAVFTAGVVAMVGFAIDKDGLHLESAALEASNEAAAELYASGRFAAPADVEDPALELLAEDERPQEAAGDGEQAGGGPVDEDALLGNADANTGMSLFFSNGCNVCHGDTGEGIIGPKIAGTGLSLSAVIGQYRSPQDAMPAFPADRVPDQDVAHIYTWLQTLQ